MECCKRIRTEREKKIDGAEVIADLWKCDGMLVAETK